MSRNSPTRTINYKPRMTQWDAYDKLPPQVQHALQTAVISFDSYSVYRHVQKHGIRKTLAWVAAGNNVWARHDLQPPRGVKGRKGYRPAEPSTVVSCKVKPLGANWTPTYKATKEMHP
jgi:hypothetical protein